MLRPDAPPPRLTGWERAFVSEMDAVIAAPFGYGPDEVDCLRAVARICTALTGQNPLAGAPSYKSEAGAFKALSKRGFADVEAAMASVFPVIAPVRALRGDCGAIVRQVDGRQIVAAAIVVQNHMAMVKGVDGPGFVPVRALRTVFGVGAR